jgi:hypothetical protein
MGHLVEAPKSFTLFQSPMVRVDGTKDEWERCSINLYYHHGEEGDDWDIDDAKQWGVIFGPTEQITRMRAEVVCRGVNKMRPPVWEYPAIVGIFDKEKRNGQAD